MPVELAARSEPIFTCALAQQHGVRAWLTFPPGPPLPSTWKSSMLANGCSRRASLRLIATNRFSTWPCRNACYPVKILSSISLHMLLFIARLLMACWRKCVAGGYQLPVRFHLQSDVSAIASLASQFSRHFRTHGSTSPHRLAAAACYYHSGGPDPADQLDPVIGLESLQPASPPLVYC